MCFHFTRLHGSCFSFIFQPKGNLSQTNFLSQLLHFYILLHYWHWFFPCPKLHHNPKLQNMPVLTSSSSSSFTYISLSIFLLLILYNTTVICSATTRTKTTHPNRQLSVNYYAKSCPQVEQLIGSITSQQFKESPVSGPATIRLFFHDCFVEVITTPSNNAHWFGLNFLHACAF